MLRGTCRNYGSTGLFSSRYRHRDINLSDSDRIVCIFDSQRRHGCRKKSESLRVGVLAPINKPAQLNKRGLRKRLSLHARHRREIVNVCKQEHAFVGFTRSGTNHSIGKYEGTQRKGRSLAGNTRAHSILHKKIVKLKRFDATWKGGGGSSAPKGHVACKQNRSRARKRQTAATEGHYFANIAYSRFRTRTADPRYDG